MRSPKTKTDKVSIYRATDIAKVRIANLRQSLLNVDTDPKKNERLEKSLCKHCFYVYSTRMGGSAITYRECSICEKDQTYSSTATDPLCLPCAKENELCKQCGGDIRMKHIRSRRKFETNRKGVI